MADNESLRAPMVSDQLRHDAGHPMTTGRLRKRRFDTPQPTTELSNTSDNSGLRLSLVYLMSIRDAILPYLRACLDLSIVLQRTRGHFNFCRACIAMEVMLND